MHFCFSSPTLLSHINVTTAADDILKYVFFNHFSEKIILDILCESSVKTIHIKCQVLFSLKIIIRLSSATILLGALRIKCNVTYLEKIEYGM